MTTNNEEPTPQPVYTSTQEERRNRAIDRLYQAAEKKGEELEAQEEPSLYQQWHENFGKPAEEAHSLLDSMLGRTMPDVIAESFLAQTKRREQDASKTTEE